MTLFVKRIAYCLLNPLEAKRQLNIDLRSVKTDKRDAHRLAQIHGQFLRKQTQSQTEVYKQTRDFARFYQQIERDMKRTRMNLHTALQLTFPELETLLNNNWRYFKADCKKKLLEEKTGSIYRKRKIEVEPVYGHLKAQLAFHRFHLRGKEGAKIDIQLALMALNLRKLATYMKGKVSKIEKYTPDFDLIHQNQAYILFKKDYCPRIHFAILLYKLICLKRLLLGQLMQ
ncbi:transposase [Enterococcus durans]|nr:transposase [Enterococcus durans]MDT2836566.1 transposase [Enterococcus durans]